MSDLQEATETSREAGQELRRQMPWCLRVLANVDEDLAGREVALQSELHVGRSPASQPSWVVDDRRMSRDHFSVHGGPHGAWELRDEGSKNGTYLDGSRVVGTAPLREGALVRAGGLLCELGRQTIPVPGQLDDPLLIGGSHAIRRVIYTIRSVARAGMPVLITGPTGAGKDLVARRLHALSGRSGELVALNCAAVPPELFESYLFGHRRGAFTGAIADSPGYFAQADRGTLFLDELGELPLAMQPKLLRVLDQGEYQTVGAATPRRIDVRVVAATNVDLTGAMLRSDFRRDLYARLAGCVISMPSLRERRGDIILLARHLLEREAPGWSVRFSPGLLERLLLHPWPLNVRELVACVKRLALLANQADVLDAEHLPADLLAAVQPLGEARAEREDPHAVAPPAAPTAAPSREQLEALLARHEGNVMRVARDLGRDRTQIYRWLQRHDLSPDAFRKPSPP